MGNFGGTARLLEVIEQRDLANTNRILSRLEMQEGYSINSTVFFAGKSVPVASESPLMQYGDRLRLNIRGLHRILSCMEILLTECS